MRSTPRPVQIIFLLLFLLLGNVPNQNSLAIAAQGNKKSTSVHAIVLTSMGSFDIRLFHTHAPKTVSYFIGLVRGLKETVDVETRKKVKKRFYDGLSFHRVVPNFMVQGGDPLGNGTGGPGITLDQEIHPNLEFDEPGIVAMASQKGEKIGSQFFITLSPQPELNENFTIFGQVVRGMDVVKAISEVKRDLKDKPLSPVIIKSIQIDYK